MLIETDKTETEVEARRRPDGCTGSARSARRSRAARSSRWFLAEGEEPPACGVAEPRASAAPRGRRGAAASAAAAAPARRGAAQQPDGRAFASPNARRVAAERGIDVAARPRHRPRRTHRVRGRRGGRAAVRGTGRATAPPRTVGRVAASPRPRTCGTCSGHRRGATARRPARCRSRPQVDADPDRALRHPRDASRRYVRERLRTPGTAPPRPQRPPPPAAAVAAPASRRRPSLAGCGHARHDRQADARLAAGDGAADADDGRRHGRGRRRPRAAARPTAPPRATPTTCSPPPHGRCATIRS